VATTVASDRPKIIFGKTGNIHSNSVSFPAAYYVTHWQYVQLWCSNTVFESRSIMQGCESENNNKNVYNYET